MSLRGQVLVGNGFDPVGVSRVLHLLLRVPVGVKFDGLLDVDQ